MALREHWATQEALRRVVTFLYEADEATGWSSGLEFKGLNIKKKLGYWLLIVKVHDGKVHRVHFEKSETYWGAIFAFGWNLKYGHIVWKIDRYP